MEIKSKIIITISIIIFNLFFIVGNVYASCVCSFGEVEDVECLDCVANQASNCKWNGKTTCSGSGGSEDTVHLTNPLDKEQEAGKASSITPQILIGRVINAILGIVGSLALIMFIYGGLTWMTAAGNMEKVEKGRNILLWATIGMVVIFASYSLVDFLITRALGA